MAANLIESFRRTESWDREPRRSLRLYEKLAVFERSRPRRMVLAVALALVAPAVVTGFCLDDYVLLFEMKASSPTWAGTAPFDLFRFIDPPHNSALMDGGGLPWWTLERATMSFMRPITSLTHMLDHVLWPRAAFAMHLHNLAWFGLVLFLASKAYSALIESRWVAGLAIAMFALDSAHGVAAGWIANRNALVGGAFSIATLLCHHCARDEGRRWFVGLSSVCFALALFSAELALGAIGFVVSYAVFLDRGTIKRRVLSLLPYAALTGVWAYLRIVGHYGAYALSGYVDPTREPLEFARVLPSRVAVFFASQSVRLGSDLYQAAASDVRLVLLLAALVLCAFTLWFIAPVLRERAVHRFWFAGSVLAMLPIAAGSPSDRMLTLVGFGFMPVLAQAVCDAFQSRPLAAASRVRERRWRFRAATLFVFVHLVIDPLALPLAAISPALIGAAVKPADESLTADPALRDKTVIVANVPGDSLLLTYLPVIRDFNGKPAPKRLHWLMANHETSAMFERLSANVLRVHAPSGVFEDSWQERNERVPLRLGDRVQMPEFTATVVEVLRDGRPSVCDFEFATSLDAERYVWLGWRDGRLTPLALPKLGEHLVLPAS